MEKQVAIVIPIHLEEPSELEKISLAQTLKVLGKYPIVFQTKEGLNVKWYEDFCRGKATIRFERFRWNGLKGYSKMMASSGFYHRFRDFEYILICHLDSFVFRDELAKWCEADYDYIGSCIYNTAWDTLPTRLGQLLGFVKPEYFANGGFALRKVESFICFWKSRFVRRKLFFWTLLHKAIQEDIFLAQIIPTANFKFNVAPKSESQKFGAALEHWDAKNLPFGGETGKPLPFGVHGWFNYQPEFWKPYIREFGYPV